MDHLRDSKGKAKKQTTWHSKRRTRSRNDARSSTRSSDLTIPLISILSIPTIPNGTKPWTEFHHHAIHCLLSNRSLTHSLTHSLTQYKQSNARSIQIPTAYPRRRCKSLPPPFNAVQDTQIKYRGPCSRRNPSNSLFSLSFHFQANSL